MEFHPGRISNCEMTFCIVTEKKHWVEIMTFSFGRVGGRGREQ